MTIYSSSCSGWKPRSHFLFISFDHIPGQQILWLCPLLLPKSQPTYIAWTVPVLPLNCLFVYILSLLIVYFQLSSVQFSCSVVSDSWRPHESQHARPPCPSPTPGVHSDSRPSSQWCHPAISSSVVPFSSCLHSFLASRFFPMSQLFASGGQRIGASASASILPINIQAGCPLGWAGLISLLSKGCSRVFSSITVWKHQFFGAQPPLWSNSHIHTGLLEKP